MKIWEFFKLYRKHGGIGFRDIYDTNRSFILKLRWNLLKNPNSLWAKVLKAKYFKNCLFKNSRSNNYGSSIWHSIYSIKGILLHNYHYLIANGSNVDH